RLKGVGDASGQFTIRVEESPDPDAIVDALAKVEAKSWKAQDGNRKLTTAIGRAFYRRVIDAFGRRDLLRIWTATLDGSGIAYLVRFICKGKCYYYNGAYVEDASKLSPGTVLHAAAVQDAFRAGLSEYDFLSGDEPFKERWCTARRDIDHVAVRNDRLMSFAAMSCLVSARWLFRRSKLLRERRAQVLTLIRRLTTPVPVHHG